MSLNRTADLFTVPTATFRTLFVLFYITHDRRELVHVRVTAHPTAAWIWRQLIEATAWGRKPRYVLRDRDAVSGRDFAATAHAMGIETLLAPFRSPKANAVAERVIRSLRQECLDHVLVLGERHLQAVLQEYAEYYNTERPHRSLALQPPVLRGPVRPDPAVPPGRLVARPILGGLHHVYQHAA
jgi:transposase InsO family protein